MTKDDKSQKETSHHEGDAADAGNRRVSAPKWRFKTLGKRARSERKSKQNWGKINKRDPHP